jgi:hypothetical protein
MDLQEIKDIINFVCEQEGCKNNLDVKFKTVKTYWAVIYTTRCKLYINTRLLIQPIEKQYQTIIHETLHYVLNQGHTKKFKIKEDYYLAQFGLEALRNTKAVHVKGLIAADRIVWHESLAY